MLAYIQRTHLSPPDWPGLQDLLMQRFQPRDLTAAYKAQFPAQRRQHSEDIHAYVKALQKLADLA